MNLLAAILLFLPLSTPVHTGEGWQGDGTIARPYAAAVNHVKADLIAQGWRLIRVEKTGGPLRPARLLKFSGTGKLLYVMLTRSGDGTLYLYRCEKPKGAKE